MFVHLQTFGYPALIQDYKEYHTETDQIYEQSFVVRKKRYIERKEFLVGMLEAQSKRLINQARFIVAVNKGKIIWQNRLKSIVDQLINEKFDPDPVKAWKDHIKKKELEMCGEVEMEKEEESEDNETSTDAGLREHLAEYSYLLKMPFKKFSEEEKDRLLKESGGKLVELEELKKKTGADLWEHNRKVLEEALEKQEEKELQDIEDAIKTAQSKLVKGGAPGKAKKNKVNVDVSSFKPNPGAEMVTPVEEDNKKGAKRKSTAPLKVKKTKRAKIKSDDDEDFRI
uniref:TOP4c domain-containing protein n=1 Tax=Strongyloides papillosus TaxID=174720 RepID=A0A0N5CBC8_STREA